MIRKIQNINNLEDKINYKFKDINLLEEALTHSSFKNNTKSNQERLEFLGDRVLGLVIAEYLFQNFISDGEGELLALEDS